MKIITINLSEPHIKALQVLQDIGLYPSRSEAIRVAIRDFLQKELGFAKEIIVIERDGEVIEEFEKQKPTSMEERKKQISRLIRKLEKERDEETQVKI